jgi:hypothetical protein
MKVAYPTGEFCLLLDEGGLMCIQYLYLCSLHCLNSAAVVFGALLGVYEIQIQIPLIRMKSFLPYNCTRDRACIGCEQAFHK